MKKKLFCCVIAFMLMVAGCAELPTASYADGSPESSESASESQNSKDESKVSAVESGGITSLPPKEVSADTLRICVDIDYVLPGSERDTQIGMDRFLQLAAEKGGPTDVAVEYIPASGAEREIVLENLRVELMSGKGPDLFILSGSSIGQGALFPLIEVSMRSGVFLPLDTYIENAQFMEWDKLTPKVMKAGRTEEGQLVVPLTYTMPITFYRKSEVSHTPSMEMTWQDMVTDETGILRNAASAEVSAFSLVSALGELADFDEKKLLFSEEELLQCVKDVIAIEEAIQNGEFDHLPSFEKREIGVRYGLSWKTSLKEDGLKEDEATTMIPIYSDNGGVTATITNYACINRNSEHAEEAFYMLDLLLSREVQQEAGWYKLYHIWCQSGGNAVPMHMDLMQEDYPITTESSWFMTEENFAAFSAVREQITQASFRGSLDAQLEDLMYACLGGQPGSVPEETVEELVAEAYKTMEKMLSE